MSNNIAKLDNIFKVLYQDHSYYLTYPGITRKPRSTKISNYMDMPDNFYKYHSWEGNVAASKIQNFLRSVRDRRIFNVLKKKLFNYMHVNPSWLLKRIDHMCFTLFEKDNYTVVFRLAGEIFPPNIVYKIFGRQYVISSYNFPIQPETRTKNQKNRQNGSGKSTIKLLPDKKNDWKVCYVYKSNKVVSNKTLTIKPLNSCRKNTNSISWIPEKYGR